MSDIKTKVIDPIQQQAIFDNLIKYAIAPRPICFASTVDAAGQVNLSPFSYFNLMSHQPPVCVFSPLRRMRDGTTKHTLENITEVKEVVINIVNYDMVQQQSLASTEYAKGINEFEKSGFTALPSTYVTPPRVAESPVQLECKVKDIIALSDDPGAGNLVLAEVVCMHIHEDLLDSDNQVDQAKLDLVARLGGDWYCRVTEESLFKVPKPLRNLGIGIDQLPESIRFSTVLTGNHLGMLANVEVLPEFSPTGNTSPDQKALSSLEKWKDDPVRFQKELHIQAAKLLDTGELQKAWQLLLLGQ
ncbi:Flavin reductase like domain [Sphingobacterium spiritivorum]|uniref:Flavin reductase like domain n=1 Tax=Sphingobacterium spiritivorum TaxID=258 RepID=A0A380BX96_SPHSI|nr:flavin reductase family protein [Sphingobacterium spiritivorum]SUJ08690.1 Flavin reductase like domain [Sphingobacterium spiritivorum]